MRSPYDAPAARDARPVVVHAYRAYAALMFVGYLAATIAFTFVAPSADQPALVPAGAAAFAVFYALACFAPAEPWGWTLGFVAIALGLPGVGVVVALPLLIAWLRPTTKAAFRRPP